MEAHGTALRHGDKFTSTFQRLLCLFKMFFDMTQQLILSLIMTGGTAILLCIAKPFLSGRYIS